jgi:hypothetical protein
MISDILSTLVLGLFAVSLALPIAGCLAEPTFADRCSHCGEYLEDAAAAHEHFTRCSPCR